MVAFPPWPRGRSYITYINSTSSGKSLVYLLPAYIKRDHLYIVITPRLALKEDLYRRACDLKLRPSRFEDPITILDRGDLSNRAPGSPSVQSQRHVRPRHAPRPLLQLLNTRFGIGNFNSIIRGSSNRSDISYRRVYFRAREDRDEALCNTLQSINQEDSDVRNKILIFVTNKKQGEDLARLFDSQVVYSGKEDLQSTIQRFIESSSWRTLITTSVLEAGIDIRQIKYTTSIEPIYSLISVVQCSASIRQRGVSYIICQQPTKYSTNEIRDIQDFGEFDKAWYRLLTFLYT